MYGTTWSGPGNQAPVDQFQYGLDTKQMYGPGEKAPKGGTQVSFPPGWNPGPDTSFGVLHSPAGQTAPKGLKNFTPSLNTMHNEGAMAPAGMENYSLVGSSRKTGMGQAEVGYGQTDNFLDQYTQDDSGDASPTPQPTTTPTPATGAPQAATPTPQPSGDTGSSAGSLLGTNAPKTIGDSKNGYWVWDEAQSKYVDGSQFGIQGRTAKNESPPVMRVINKHFVIVNSATGEPLFINGEKATPESVKELTAPSTPTPSQQHTNAEYINKVPLPKKGWYAAEKVNKDGTTTPVYFDPSSGWHEGRPGDKGQGQPSGAPPSESKPAEPSQGTLSWLAGHVGNATQKFGSGSAWNSHEDGVDINTPLGTQVPLVDGTVTAVTPWGSGDYAVTVRQDDGQEVTIGHIAQPTQKVGDKVTSNDSVMSRGADESGKGFPGLSSGPQVEIRVAPKGGKNYVDPLSIIKDVPPSEGDGTPGPRGGSTATDTGDPNEPGAYPTTYTYTDANGNDHTSVHWVTPDRTHYWSDPTGNQWAYDPKSGKATKIQSAGPQFQAVGQNLYSVDMNAPAPPSMGPENYVAPEGDKFKVRFGGKDVGEFGSQQAAESKFNALSPTKPQVTLLNPLSPQQEQFYGNVLGQMQGLMGQYGAGTQAFKKDFGLGQDDPMPTEGQDVQTGNAPMDMAPPIPPQDAQGIGSRFGETSPVDGEPHLGTDVQAVKGTPVLNRMDGVVVKVENRPMLGLTVVVKDAKGVEHTYGHLASAAVKPGDKVQKGQPIAQVGESGSGATGPNLHYSMSRNGQPMNPEPSMGPMGNMPMSPNTVGQNPQMGQGQAEQGYGMSGRVGYGQSAQDILQQIAAEQGLMDAQTLLQSQANNQAQLGLQRGQLTGLYGGAPILNALNAAGQTYGYGNNYGGSPMVLPSTTEQQLQGATLQGGPTTDVMAMMGQGPQMFNVPGFGQPLTAAQINAMPDDVKNGMLQQWSNIVSPGTPWPWGTLSGGQLNSAIQKMLGEIGTGNVKGYSMTQAPTLQAQQLYGNSAGAAGTGTATEPAKEFQQGIFQNQLNSALSNPWMTSLNGMAPGYGMPGWTKGMGTGANWMNGGTGGTTGTPLAGPTQTGHGQADPVGYGQASTGGAGNTGGTSQFNWLTNPTGGAYTPSAPQPGQGAYMNVDVPSGGQESESATAAGSYGAGTKMFTDPYGYGFYEQPTAQGANWIATGQQSGFSPGSFNPTTQGGSYQATPAYQQPIQATGAPNWQAPANFLDPGMTGQQFMNADPFTLAAYLTQAQAPNAQNIYGVPQAQALNNVRGWLEAQGIKQAAPITAMTAAANPRQALANTDLAQVFGLSPQEYANQMSQQYGAANQGGVNALGWS